jgi:hypothetical protein
VVEIGGAAVIIGAFMAVITASEGEGEGGIKVA